MEPQPSSGSKRRISLGRISLRRIPPGLVLRLIALVGLMVTGIALLRFTPLGEYLTEERMVALLDELQGLWWTPLLLIGAFTFLAPLGLPMTPLVLGGGAVFGAWWGGLYNIVGLLLGAHTSFWTARFLGRDLIVHFAGERLRRAERIFERHSFWPLVQARFLPMPFAISNFGAALAGVKSGTFFITTLIGLIPSTLVHTYFMARLFRGADRQVTMVQYVVVLALFNIATAWPTIRTQLYRRRRYRELREQRRQRG